MKKVNQITEIQEMEMVKMYTENRYTLRHLSEIFDIDHHRTKRILEKHNVEITPRKTLKEYIDEHRWKISETSKGRKTWINVHNHTREAILKNMKAHLKYDVTYEWLNSFEDVQKLKYLNNSIKRKRDYNGFTSEIYVNFIEKFYNDKKFNNLYIKWITNKDKWIKPSLDHIIPKSKGGSLFDLNNLQFISWFENRSKVDINQNEWNKLKININDYF